ncbi:MAG: porin family protein [Alcanivorax sp.]|nr:porin family protein [Alcanivorax sp.]
MKALLRGALIVSLLAVAGPTMAQGTGYASLGYVFSSLEPRHSNNDASVNALQFTFGGWLNAQQTFGAEGRIALGVGSDTITFTDATRRRVEIDRYYGAYLRAQFPNTVPIRPYGLFGTTLVETTERLTSSRSRRYSDISLGLGVEVDLDSNIFLSLEYLRAVDRNSSEVSNLTVGVGGRF